MDVVTLGIRIYMLDCYPEMYEVISQEPK